MKGCSGLVGLILGHEFTHIYDVDKRPVKAEELASALLAATSHNFWNYSKQIDPNKFPTENVTKIYKHSVCNRCGMTINLEKTCI